MLESVLGGCPTIQAVLTQPELCARCSLACGGHDDSDDDEGAYTEPI